MRKTTKTILAASGVIACAIALGIWDSQKSTVEASSHREAPLIANDPLADNTDLYAFRSPDDSNTVTILANYVPLQLPQGGPNYASFGENVRYEIHIKNDGGWKRFNENGTIATGNSFEDLQNHLSKSVLEMNF